MFGAELDNLPVTVLMWGRSLYDAGRKAGMLEQPASARAITPAGGGGSASGAAQTPPAGSQAPSRDWEPDPNLKPNLPDAQIEGAEDGTRELTEALSHEDQLAAATGGTADPPVQPAGEGQYAAIGHYTTEVVQPLVKWAEGRAANPPKAAQIIRHLLAKAEPRQQAPPSGIHASAEAMMKRLKVWRYADPAQDTDMAGMVDGSGAE